MKCIGCGSDDDEDICGFCFADAMSEVRHEWKTGKESLDIFRSERLICVMADVRIRLEHAKQQGYLEAVEIYEHIQRMFDA